MLKQTETLERFSMKTEILRSLQNRPISDVWYFSLTHIGKRKWFMYPWSVLKNLLVKSFTFSIWKIFWKNGYMNGFQYLMENPGMSKTSPHFLDTFTPALWFSTLFTQYFSVTIFLLGKGKKKKISNLKECYFSSRKSPKHLIFKLWKPEIN